LGLRDKLKRLQRETRKHLGSFELRDGTTYYFDPMATYAEMFLHAHDTELGRGEDWPEHPEVAFVNPADLYDLDALVNERRLVPIKHPEPVEDLSE
jgi:hypothetical protein